MRKILLILLLFSFISAHSQSPAGESSDDDSLNILLNLFLNMDLVIGPEIYNPENDPDLEYVIFMQDTIFSSKENSGSVNAAINRGESKEKYYCIGTVRNYRIADYIVGFAMKKGYSDGDEEIIYHPIHFDEILFSFNIDYDYATYGVDVDLYWVYGEGVMD